MPRRSAFAIALPEITRHLDDLQRPALSDQDLTLAYHENHERWKLPRSWSVTRFIEALLAVPDLLFPFEADFGGSQTVRYGWRASPQPADFALALHRGAYLAYYTAMTVHRLTDQRPKTIYLCVEQTRKATRGSLTQAGIHAAFAKPQRLTTNVGVLSDGYRIVRVNGMYTGRVGVMRTEGGRHVTNLERTLLDATVRPAYSGGVDEVLEAYRRAAGVVSINKLVAMLRKLDHVYPYHQAVGFYLRHSGAYSTAQVERLHAFAKTFDFYLAHDMGAVAYDEEWRLHYPAAWSATSGANVVAKKSK